MRRESAADGNYLLMRSMSWDRRVTMTVRDSIPKDKDTRNSDLPIVTIRRLAHITAQVNNRGFYFGTLLKSNKP